MNELECCIVWNDTIQYSPKAVSYTCTSCLLLHSTIPSVTCLRLSDVSVICHVTYFQFSIQSDFFNISVARPHQHYGVLLVLIRNIGHRTLRKIRGGTFLVRNV